VALRLQLYGEEAEQQKFDPKIPPEIVEKVKEEVKALEDKSKKVITTLRKAEPHTRLDEIDYKLDKMRQEIVEHKVDVDFNHGKLADKSERLAFDLENL
jgi:hypothetical protein